jgi:tetratricopeptide (TPR) repeat protein
MAATPIDAKHGHVAAESPAALKEAGNAALAQGDTARATHMYTLGIDMILGKVAVASELSASDWYRLSQESNGVLYQLLSNRSYTLLTQGDAAAAAEDGEHCAVAAPDFAKGHLRLLAALAAVDPPCPIPERQAVVARALRACPTNAQLREAEAELNRFSVSPGQAAAAKKALSETSRAESAAAMVMTRACAEDKADPRRFMACGDLGSAYAVGAHGIEKDLVQAEAYLKRGSDGGDMASARNLGLLLLELDRPEEAAEQLRRAALAGDEQAGETLAQLDHDAKLQAAKARAQLEALASRGEPRALELLEQLKRDEEGTEV